MNESFEKTALQFIKKEEVVGEPFVMTSKEAQAIVQMIYATYNKVDQLCAAMYRQEHERNSQGSINSRNPFL